MHKSNKFIFFHNWSPNCDSWAFYILCYFILQALGDIEIAVSMLDSGDHSINPIERHYQTLDIGLQPMAKSDPMYKV